MDAAGNKSPVLKTAINIDKTAPTITNIPVNGKQYVIGEKIPGPNCVAVDTLSGPLGCSLTVDPSTSGVGKFTYTATATDVAGNTNTATGSYSVIYDWDGFLQPINDTAHQQGATSVFKAGSTVPVKFQLKSADGTVVQAKNAPKWLSPAAATDAAPPSVNESVYTDTESTGPTFRWDAASRQYIYNWSTKDAKVGTYRIGVQLDDGQTYYVTIGLR
jgi:hypothetical protein